MEKTIGKRGKKTIKGRIKKQGAVIKKIIKKRRINNAALAVARWLN